MRCGPGHGGAAGCGALGCAVVDLPELPEVFPRDQHPFWDQETGVWIVGKQIGQHFLRGGVFSTFIVSDVHL